MSLINKDVFDNLRKCKQYKNSIQREMYLFPLSMPITNKKCTTLDEELFTYKPTTHGEIMNFPLFTPSGLRVGLRRHNFNPRLEYFQINYSYSSVLIIFICIMLLIKYMQIY